MITATTVPALRQRDSVSPWDGTTALRQYDSPATPVSQPNPAVATFRCLPPAKHTEIVSSEHVFRIAGARCVSTPLYDLVRSPHTLPVLHTAGGAHLITARLVPPR